MNSSQMITHSKRLSGGVAALCAFLNFTALSTPAVLDSAVNPANSHIYYLLENSTWTNAENAAVAMGGTLATVNDLAENNWIWNRWGTNRNLWIGLHDPIVGDGSGAQHAANFVWASGDSSAYRNWRPGEPNNSLGDYYTYILAKGLVAEGGVWNDVQDSLVLNGQPPFYGVVEVEVCTPHRATATAVLFGTFVVSATISDPGCGYTNAPTVSIQGGGGSGATATASITNGHVVAITITSTGNGYTNAPQILFSSPPFVPTVGINVSKVKVTMRLMVGLNYLLEASTNLINWTATGPSFTATNETMSAEFDVDLIGRYFRIHQVP